MPGGLSIDGTTGLIAGTIDYWAAVGSPYTVIVTATDPGGLTGNATFTWNVANTNQTPVVTNPGAQTSAEGAVISLQIGANDPDLESLTYSASGLPGGLSLDGTTGLIAGTIDYWAAVGSPYTVIVTATDPGGLTGNATFTWNVANTNQTPVVTNPGAQTSAEGAVISLQIGANDPDLESLTYSASGLPGGLSLDGTTGLIAGTIDYWAAVGSPYTVIVTATDPGGLTGNATFTWNVANTNQTPVVTNPGAQTSAEGAVISLQIGANDPDLESLTYSASGLPGGLSLDGTTGLIAGTIDYWAAVGSPYTVIVTATDPGGLTGNATFTWNVANTNQTPVVTNPGAQTSAEGAVISLQIGANDPDLESLTYSASGLPGGLSLDGTTGLIAGTIDYWAAVGSPYTVIVTATDPGGLTGNATFTWNVANTNQTPVVTNPGAQTSAEGAVISLQIGANDPDLESLTYSASGLPGGLSLDGTTGLIAGTIDYWAAVGSPYTVIVTATDPGGLTGNATFTWNVANTNQTPVVTNPGAQTSAEGAVISLQIGANDPDLESLTYSASGLPGGLSLDGTTGLIAGTIDYWAAVGSPYTVIVTATDPGGLTGNATFTWNVANTNQTPVVTNPGAQTSAEGAVISLQIGANDPDLESLTYSASGLPGGLSIDGTTGLIAGTIDYWAAVGSPYTVIVTATDPGGLTGNATFTWNVANTNQTPVVTNPGAQTSAEGAVISLQIGANDPDLESLTYSASGLPGGLSIDGTTGLIAGTIDYWAAVGSPYTVIVTATDPGGLTGNATFTWNVANTNQTPVVTNPGAQTSAEGAVISLQIGANDPDLESLTYSASGLPGGLSIDGTTGLIAGTIDYWAAVGSPYTVIVTATDPGGLTGNATFTWNVANTNQTPVVTNPGAQTSAEGAVISLQIGANDPDLESLTYSASGLPGGLSIDGTTGLIAGTIDYWAAVGSPYTVIVTATDPGGLTGNATFTWNVANTNQTPVVTNPGAQTSAEGAVISLQIGANDPDLSH